MRDTVSVFAEEPPASEIERMWVSMQVPAQGLGGRLLDELEARAIDAGKSVTRLETDRGLTAAMAMYRKHRCHEIPPFNSEPFGDHWFEKDLRDR